MIVKTIAIDEEYHKKLSYLKTRWNLKSLRRTIEVLVENASSGILSLIHI